VRERSVTVTMHLLRRLLQGKHDADGDGPAVDDAPPVGEGEPERR
jgi:hypothetical protein